MLKSTIEIDRRLAADTVYVTTLSLSQVRLMNDARFPWLVLVPKSQATELTDLSPLERGALMEEVASVSKALTAVVAIDKVNVGALGNIVPQLHVHVVGRRRDDAAWPGPVWGSGTAEPYEPEAREYFVNQIAEALHGPADLPRDAEDTVSANQESAAELAALPAADEPAEAFDAARDDAVEK
jgi:diadenosine tetraphosphate (Ap4A) HIT family hydrolase